jgi:hypothetical protein
VKILLFLLCAFAASAQQPFNATNLKLTTVPAQGTAASVSRFYTLANTTNVGATVTPTVAWSAIVLTGTVDTTDISGFSALGRSLVDDVLTSDMQTTLGATTVGKAFFTTANPSAITFPRVNADNTLTYRSAANYLTDLGGTTVGQSYLTLANPSAITFPRQNANNTVTSRTAAELKTDLATTTNDSAGAGEIGQYTSSLVAVGSLVSLTTATAANVTSISLTAGDWDVEGNINVSYTAATMTAFTGGIGSTSATLPTDGSEVQSGLTLTTTTVKNGVTVPRKRMSLAGTTTVYLVASTTFTAGTAGAYGGITARRVR